MLNVTNKKDEPLLGRTLVNATLEFEKSTPTYAEVTQKLAHALKKDEKLLAVRHVYTDFGHKKANVVAYVYNDEAKKQFVEPKVKEKKAKAGQEVQKK